MSAREHCDEIIRLIDEVLGEAPPETASDDGACPPAAGPARRHQPGAAAGSPGLGSPTVSVPPLA